MSERVTMPALGESVTEGTVTRWLKAVGERVEVDEPLLEVSTDKVDTEIPSPVAGCSRRSWFRRTTRSQSVPISRSSVTVPVAATRSRLQRPRRSPPKHRRTTRAKAVTATRSTTPRTRTRSRRPGTRAARNRPSPRPRRLPAAGNGRHRLRRRRGQRGTTVTMPALGESVTEGTITRWLKAEGDDVAVDEPLLRSRPTRSTPRSPSPAAGKLTKILAGRTRPSRWALTWPSSAARCPAVVPARHRLRLQHLSPSLLRHPSTCPAAPAPALHLRPRTCAPAAGACSGARTCSEEAPSGAPAPRTRRPM